ncbi:MAG: hypothetical protein KJ749_03750, partial [Planctomycetes bacterium]|nr:hypothetical protein [Planctomycetota bacterium]
CPECGTPVDAKPRTALQVRRRIKSALWSRALPLWLLVVTLITGILGYVEISETWICSECCLHQYRVTHEFGIPFGGPVLFKISGDIHTPSPSHWPLVQQLDPHEKCRHSWVHNGYIGTGLAGGTHCIRPDFCRTVVQRAPDFEQFVGDRPDVLSRIRTSIRQMKSIDEWLFDEYADWTDTVDGAAPDD